VGKSIPMNKPNSFATTLPPARPVKWWSFLPGLGLTLIFAALLLIGCGTRESVSHYMPLSVGNTWVYVDADGRKLETSVTGTRQVGDARCFVLRARALPDGPDLRTDYLAWTKAGLTLFRVGMGGEEAGMSPVEVILSPPFRKERGWSWEGKAGADRSRASYTVAGFEDRKVLGKTQSCLKIRLLVESEVGGKVAAVRWYAPGVGLVREESTFTAPSGATPQVLNLESFKPGSGK